MHANAPCHDSLLQLLKHLLDAYLPKKSVPCTTLSNDKNLIRTPPIVLVMLLLEEPQSHSGVNLCCAHNMIY